MDNDGCYTAPDFFKDFKCKCGDCRQSCCEGWDISVSEDEYFRIMSLECSEDMQKRIDRAFYIPKDASAERYALLNHDWLGRCPMRAEDGLCALQVEKGEALVPNICRLYPRSYWGDLGEATVSDSCEQVLEMLAHRTAPIAFININGPAAGAARKDAAETDVRRECIRIIGKNGSCVRDRLLEIGRYLVKAEPEENDFPVHLKIMEDFLSTYQKLSLSIEEYCSEALRSLSGLTLDVFSEKKTAFLNRFPFWENFIGNVYVNHFFYEKFPYSDKRENEEDEFVSVCGMHSFLDFLLIGNLKKLVTEDDLIDLVSMAFRVIEHTSFYYNSHVLLKKYGYDTPSKAESLILF